MMEAAGGSSRWSRTFLLVLAAAVLGAPGDGGAWAAGGPARLVSVIVKLADEPVATYRGQLGAFAATSPAVTGARRLDAREGAVQRYRSYLAYRQRAFEAAAAAAVPAATVRYRYQMVLGGVAMLVPEDQVDALRRLPGVVAVYRDERRHLDTEKSPAFIGARAVWNRLGGVNAAGEGVIVGVLDTGIWPEHPSFSDPDPRGRAYPAPPGSATFGCDFTTGASPGPAFTCNNKLVGAYRFMAAYDACTTSTPADCPADPFTSPRDSNGHGTHTASTAAGNNRVMAEVLDIRRGLVSGVAPRAHVIAYKVCGPGTDGGCFQSDSVAAVEQAINDGVHVINFSISGGRDPYIDPVELAFRDAYAAGVFVAASAGNSGPAADTVHHRGPWVTTVAASTQKREFASTATLRADSGETLELGGASITGGVTTFLPLALADDAPYADPRCLTPAAPGTFTGKIVVCERGTNARIAKSWNVAQGGAAGMILYDTDPAEHPATDNHTIPSVHLDAAAGDSLLTFASLSTGVTARFTPGKPRPTPGDVMAGFSSRGGTDQTLGISKPDITAPGVAILAGHTPEPELPADPPGELFQAIQGTSMSSPHVAGAAALLKDLHPDWTPGQVKSALMTTALTTGLVREDGVSPFTPFDAGSGRVDLRKAGDPGVTFDVPVNDFIVHAADLWNINYPSIFVPDLAGSTTVQRTARSVLPTTTVWELTVTGPPDLPVSVPAQISVPAGDQTPFTIGIDGTAVPAGQARHATLELRQGTRRLHLPITVTGARPRPDLVVTAVSGASTATAGGTIANISVTVRNNGPATAGRFTTHWFFSTDTQFTPDDVQFADCVLLSLGASGQFTCNFTNVAVPSTLAPGIYRLVAIVDIFGQVAESAETNNENFSAGTVTVN